MAIRSALAQVGVLILQDHADDCVEDAVTPPMHPRFAILRKSSPIEERGNEAPISKKRLLIDRRKRTTFPRLHPLKDDQAGRSSIEVNGPWRIPFEWGQDGHVYRADLEQNP